MLNRRFVFIVLVTLFFLVVVLRFFPAVILFVEGAALSSIRFWWVLMIALLCVYAFGWTFFGRFKK